MTARDSNSGDVTATMRGEHVVSDAMQLTREFGAAQSLDGDDLARLCVIVEELVANLLEHGGLDADHAVTLTLRREARGVRVLMIDPTAPFDPRAAPETAQVPERGGGAGIAIVRAWTELLDYSVTGEGNRLDLLLPFASRN